MNKILQKEINILLDEFRLNIFVYDHESLNKLKQLDDQKLINLINDLEEFAKLNETITIYSKDEKNNLYDVLTYYRERFKTDEFYDKINRIISSLNRSTDDCYEKYYIGQYNIRYNFLTRFKDIETDINIDEIKELAISSMLNDYNFLMQLIYFDDSTFAFNNFSNMKSFTNLCNLIFRCPDVLFDYKLRTKILNLLQLNLNYMETDLEEDTYNCPEYLGMQSKELIKKINVITR